ncbi:MAG: hypothetical protein RR137_08980 [Odoribacter sp.]
MSELNKPMCNQAGANSGVPDCDFVPGRIIGAILLNKSKVFSGVELDDFVSTLKKSAQSPINDRVYPIFRFGTLNDGSVEPTAAALGIGYEKYINDGSYKLTFPLVNGSACYVEHLRKFNGGRYACLLVHDNGITGVRIGDGVRGFTLSQFYAHKPKMGDDANSTTYNVEIAMPNPKEFVDQLAFLNTDNDIEYEIKGVRDYMMVQKSAAAATVTVDIIDTCSKQSIIGIYGNELADTTLWTGATAVVVANGLLSFTGTFSTGKQIICANTEALALKGIGGSPEYGVEIQPLSIIIK